MEIALLYIFSAALLIQLFFYWFFYSRIAFQKKKALDHIQDFPPTSVIVAARNEADNLLNYLPKVLEQHYPIFEVIVVDDCSVDETSDVLRALAAKYPHLHHTSVKENREFEGGKKFALTLGIKAAKYENLVFIDADCYPSSEQWLRYMVTGLVKRPVVLAYGGMEKQPGVLNALIRFETAVIAMQYLSFAKAGIPYMGVGRNLAYKQFLFFDQKGFSRHLDLKSGDDDLFVNAVSNSKNTTVVFSPDAYTFSPAKDSFQKWIRQKKRHLTTSVRYKAMHQFLLGLIPLSQLLFFVSFIALLFFPEYRICALAGFGIRLSTQLLVWFFTFSKLGLSSLTWVGPIFEVFFMLFYPTVGLLNGVDKFNAWKRK